MTICGYCETQNNADSSLCISCHAPLDDDIAQRRNKTQQTTFHHNIKDNIDNPFNVGITANEAYKNIMAVFG